MKTVKVPECLCSKCPYILAFEALSKKHQISGQDKSLRNLLKEIILY